MGEPEVLNDPPKNRAKTANPGSEAPETSGAKAQEVAGVSARLKSCPPEEQFLSG
jgi:hypothetical protein